MSNVGTDIQDLIRSIQRDTALSPSEKSTKISQTMREWNQRKAQEKESPKVDNNISNSEVKDIVCKHYTRGCDIQCTTCKKFYPCRVCHDEHEDHTLDRFKVDTVKCRVCKRVQGPSKNCIYCKSIFGFYYCETCHLWENSGKAIFHCDKCGICRVGNRDDYIHCDICNHCYTKEWYKDHKCVSDGTKTECAICGEFLHNSRKPITTLKCGHSMHQECFRELLKRGETRCPYCKKSMTDMTEFWQQLDLLAPMEQMPDDYKNKRMVVYCCDCEKKSDINFSFEFKKCTECGSYNTQDERVYNLEEDESKE